MASICGCVQKALRKLDAVVILTRTVRVYRRCEILGKALKIILHIAHMTAVTNHSEGEGLYNLASRELRTLSEILRLIASPFIPIAQTKMGTWQWIIKHTLLATLYSLLRVDAKKETHI